MVLHDEPAPPRRLRPEVPEDLEAISLRCLQKTAAERYPTAAALAADLRHFLAGEPVEAVTVDVLGQHARWAAKLGYELVELLGCGRGGYAYHARKTRISRSVLLKINLSAGTPGVAPDRFRRQGELAAALRLLDDTFQSLAELGMPESLDALCDLSDGLVIIGGPTGAGKSTTLATLIDRINRTHACHIVTIEDPIEYLHRPQKALVNQRQVGSDAPSFNDALVASLRQDPDVILVGEVRELATIRTAITASETITFSQAAALLASGALAGSATCTFSEAAALVAPGVLVAAESLTFSEAGVILGAGALAGQASIDFSETAALAGAGVLAGSDGMTLGMSGTVDAIAYAAASEALTFSHAAPEAIGCSLELTLYVVRQVAMNARLDFPGDPPPEQVGSDIRSGLPPTIRAPKGFGRL